MTWHRGTTLVELLVVLMILGILATVAAFAPGGRVGPRPDEDFASLMARHRRTAILVGSEATVLFPSDSGPPRAVRFLPDGRILGDGLDTLRLGRR